MAAHFKAIRAISIVIVTTIHRAIFIPIFVFLNKISIIFYIIVTIHGALCANVEFHISDQKIGCLVRFGDPQLGR